MKRVQFCTKQHGRREQSSPGKPGKKLVWDFEYKMRKTATARRPDQTLEDAEERIIWIVDMACPTEANIAEKRREKSQNTNS